MPNILVPTDFSANAAKAFEYAVILFGTDARYTLVHGFEVPYSGATMLISIADILEKDALHGLTEARDQLVKKIPEVAGNVDIRTETGTPAVAIGKLAETGEFDVVVMGTKGATGLKEVFVGSVTSNTLTDVSIPVVAVPEGATLSTPKKILFAADDQCLTEGKLPEKLEELSKRSEAEVLILNVVPEGGISYVGNSEGQENRPDGIFKGVDHSIHFIEDNDVNQGIERFIRENDVDMLAMVTRRNDIFSRLFGKSNTKSMAMHSQIPLFAFH